LFLVWSAAAKAIRNSTLPFDPKEAVFSCGSMMVCILLREGPAAPRGPEKANPS
jgi:hypothetical protein